MQVNTINFFLKKRIEILKFTNKNLESLKAFYAPNYISQFPLEYNMKSIIQPALEQVIINFSFSLMTFFSLVYSTIEKK